jgi:hypothetical protein
MNDELAFWMEEATTRSFEADLVADDAPISGDVLLTLTLTLKQAYTQAVINNREDQNVLDTNDVMVDSAGHLIWSVRVEDSTILNRSLWQEPRRCLFKWTYISGADLKAGSFEFLIWVTRNAAQ